MDRFFLRFVPLLLLTASLVTGCFDQGAEEDPEAAEEASYREERAERDASKKEVAELKAEKKRLEKELESLEEALENEAEIREKEVKASADLATSREYVARLEGLEASVDGALQGWRAATRGSFRGVQLPEIVTVGGTTYTQVTLQSVGDDSITITHQGGDATIPILELPLGLRRNVIHEPTVLTERSL